MRRTQLLTVLAIVGAFVVAIVLSVWITWGYVIPDLRDEGRFLAPGAKFTVQWVMDGLEATPDRDPDALGAALGVPVERLDAARLAELSTQTRIALRLGDERMDIFVRDDRDERFAVLHTARGPLLITSMRRMSPFNRKTLPVWFAVSTLVAALASVVLLAPLSRRLRQIEETATRLSSGDLSARAELGGPTRDLAAALNTMAERTEAVLRSHEELLQAVAHELRTPTARIRFGVELLATAEAGAPRERRVEALDRDLDELDALIRELLGFARLGARPSIADRAPLLVVPVLRDVCDELRSDAEATPTLQVEGPDVSVVVDAAAFRRAVRNVVSNALRHARTQVDVQVRVEGDAIVVAVDDDGPGVSFADRERIFAPFAVGERSRFRAASGVGLGLAIVRRIVEWHDGRVWCEASPTGGARFVMTWPSPSCVHRDVGT